MKDFSSWGTKRRYFQDYNYNAVWYNLKTIRTGFKNPKGLPPNYSEFYDIALGTKCNLNCPFCYAEASTKGIFFKDVVAKAKHFFGQMDDNQKPFQVAIGSSGEPTIHPEFIEFLEVLFNMGIVPNYTTNGITIAENSIDELLDATEKYCGGVAVSINNFNEYVSNTCIKAVETLLNLDVHTNVHMIISDENSIKELSKLYDKYGDKIHTYVLLPMMKHGRSNVGMTNEAFLELREFFSKIPYKHKSHFALGANFYPYLINQKEEDGYVIQCSLYEPESFSKNLILDDVIKITPSSFNTKTVLYEKPFYN